MWNWRDSQTEDSVNIFSAYDQQEGQAMHRVPCPLPVELVIQSESTSGGQIWHLQLGMHLCWGHKQTLITASFKHSVCDFLPPVDMCQKGMLMKKQDQ